MTTRCFRPLAGLSCINHTPGDRYGHAYDFGFRPLAGLSCINRPLMTTRFRAFYSSFRPLAGLSCINRVRHIVGELLGVGFPSPRGVELHKPFHIRR